MTKNTFSHYARYALQSLSQYAKISYQLRETADQKRGACRELHMHQMRFDKRKESIALSRMLRKSVLFPSRCKRLEGAIRDSQILVYKVKHIGGLGLFFRDFC